MWADGQTGILIATLDKTYSGTAAKTYRRSRDRRLVLAGLRRWVHVDGSSHQLVYPTRNRPAPHQGLSPLYDPKPAAGEQRQQRPHLRPRPRSLQLTVQNSSVTSECDFITRMLFKDVYWLHNTSLITLRIYTAVLICCLYLLRPVNFMLCSNVVLYMYQVVVCQPLLKLYSIWFVYNTSQLVRTVALLGGREAVNIGRSRQRDAKRIMKKYFMTNDHNKYIYMLTPMDCTMLPHAKSTTSRCTPSVIITQRARVVSNSTLLHRPTAVGYWHLCARWGSNSTNKAKITLAHCIALRALRTNAAPNPLFLQQQQHKNTENIRWTRIKDVNFLTRGTRQLIYCYQVPSVSIELLNFSHYFMFIILLL